MASVNGGSARSGRPAAVAARPSRSRIAARSIGSALTSFAWVRNEIACSGEPSAVARSAAPTSARRAWTARASPSGPSGTAS